MIRVAMTFPHVLSRRDLLAGSVVALVASSARATQPRALRVGTLPFGAVHWTIATIHDNGLDQAAGLNVESVPLASNEAARIGFLSGSIDAIFTDLLFAARLRSEGRPVKFLPYSSSEGSLIVNADSPIRTVMDLKGKSIGVAGGALDKNWLLIQAYAKKQGFDLASEAKPMFGAPPLLAVKVENGELDAGLLYWTYAARLEAMGFRSVESVQGMAEDLGARGRIAFGGFLFKDDVPEETLEAFGKVARQAGTMLGQDAEAWTKVRPLMKVTDDRTFEALKGAFQRGIPRKPLRLEIADAKALYGTLVKIGGPALVGRALTLPDELYVDAKVYG